MLELNDLKTRAEAVLRDKERGHRHLCIDLVLTDLANPLLQLIEAMTRKKGDRWLLLDELMTKTGWSRKYFEKPQKSLGNRSRLEVWKDEGLAEQADNGIWLISPARLPPRKPGFAPPDEEDVEEPQEETTTQPGMSGARTPGPEEIATQMLLEE